MKISERTLNGIETRTTRYMGKDRRWRAVILWRDYQRLLNHFGHELKSKGKSK